MQCSNHTFTGQGRLDGAVCEHTDDQKMAFLQRANASGVVNIEMECTAMAALCGKVNDRRDGNRICYHVDTLCFTPCLIHRLVMGVL